MLADLITNLGDPYTPPLPPPEPASSSIPVWHPPSAIETFTQQYINGFRLWKTVPGFLTGKPGGMEILLLAQPIPLAGFLTPLLIAYLLWWRR